MSTELLAQPADVLAAWPLYGTLPALEQSNLLSAASQAVLHYVRHKQFLQLMDTEYLDGKGLPRLWLSRRPVITVAAITINGDAVDNTSGDAWGFKPRTGELWLYPGRQDLRFARRFPHGKRNVAVEYWAGYASIPADANRAAILACRWLWEQTKVTGIYSAERIGDYSYTLNTALMRGPLPDSIASLLLSYVQDDGPL